MPEHDLAALWEAHCRCEFETRDVDATMETMVAAPYVNHIPTMAGGVGHDQLKRFYKYHFIGANPPDTAMIPVSRTIGADRIASVLVQVGKLDPRGLPVAGAETARKVLDPNQPSNALLGDAWQSSEGRPI